MSMNWQSYCEERAASCEALAQGASDLEVAEMFKALAQEWRELADSDHPRTANWPPKSARKRDPEA